MKYEKTISLYDDGIGKVEYVDHMGSDLTVVNSARVSFGVQKTELDNRDRKLIKYLIEHRHTSTLEHNLITFRFKVPLFVRSQHHRHRTWSYNEISRRYTDSGIEFYEPKTFRTQHKSNRQASNTQDLINPKVEIPYLVNEMGMAVTYAEDLASGAVKNHHQMSLNLFNQLLEAGVCREQARGVLPQNLYTEYFGTTNVSNLLKFIELRTHEGAQWEIQKVAEACLEIASDLYPETIKAYQEVKDTTEEFSS
jgi:thymidylate synthase (FAD)